MNGEQLREAQAEDVADRFRDGHDSYWAGLPGPDGWETPDGWHDPFVAGWLLASHAEHQMDFYAPEDQT